VTNKMRLNDRTALHMHAPLISRSGAFSRVSSKNFSLRDHDNDQ
jgi:hypothetical protein